MVRIADKATATPVAASRLLGSGASNTTENYTPAGLLYPVRGERNIRDLAAVGFAGDWGPKIQDWHDASSRGGALFIPDGFFEVGPVALTKGVKIRGVGYDCELRTTFGHAFWGTNSNFGGTILRGTATTGATVSLDYMRGKLDLESLALIGPGTGTSSGLLLGSVASAILQSHVRDVLIGNFATGFDLVQVEESSFYDCRAIGCGTAFSLDIYTNQNIFANAEIQYSGNGVNGDAIVLLSGGDCTSNLWSALLLQNIFGRDGIRLESGSQGNVFDTPYIERFLGAGKMVNVLTGATGNVVRNPWYNPNAGDIAIAGHRTWFGPARSNGNPTITIASGTHATVLDGCEQFLVTDSGTGTLRRDGAGIAVGAGGTAVSGVYYASAALDFGSIAAGATAELTIAVAGAAATGGQATVCPVGAIEAGLSWQGYVSAADTVTVRLANVTSGAIDPASRTWQAEVRNYTPTLPTSGLLALYLCDDGSGQVLTDTSGNAKHGQLGSAVGADTNDPTWAATGLTFDGVDNYVNIDSLAVYNNGTTAFTALLVFKGTPQSDMRIWGEGSTASTGPIISLGSDPSINNKLRAVVRNTATTTLLGYDSAAAVWDNAWHSAAWCDNNGAYAIYVDGLPDGSGSYARPTLTLDKDTLGALGRTTYGNFKNATLAAAVFYDHALTATEVLAAHRALQATLAVRGVVLP